ncbi:MAG: hypothetical protein LBK07_07715 [Tannerella sp.]|jgi:hypothetical protein|nr:hypothetical protein [Tannerella sp.]
MVKARIPFTVFRRFVRMTGFAERYDHRQAEHGEEVRMWMMILVAGCRLAFCVVMLERKQIAVFDGACVMMPGFVRMMVRTFAGAGIVMPVIAAYRRKANRLPVMMMGKGMHHDQYDGSECNG